MRVRSLATPLFYPPCSSLPCRGYLRVPAHGHALGGERVT